MFFPSVFSTSPGNQFLMAASISSAGYFFLKSTNFVFKSAFCFMIVYKPTAVEIWYFAHLKPTAVESHDILCILLTNPSCCMVGQYNHNHSINRSVDNLKWIMGPGEMQWKSQSIGAVAPCLTSCFMTDRRLVEKYSQNLLDASGKTQNHGPTDLIWYAKSYSF